MKTSNILSKIAKLAALITMVCLFSTTEASAKYGAFAYSTGSGSFGAFGLAYNYSTSSSAASAAVSYARSANGGYLNGYKYVWWSNRGYCAGARGYNYDGSRVSVGYAYGWSSANSAVNYAYGKLGSNTYSLGYYYGYNN